MDCEVHAAVPGRNIDGQLSWMSNLPPMNIGLDEISCRHGLLIITVPRL